VLNAEPEVRERSDAWNLRPGHAGVAVRFDRVTAGYDPGRPVIRDLTLEVGPGECLGVVGPTGAGKSTLAALIPRLMDPWSGSVSIAGQDVRSLTLRSLREQVALVLQEPFLFPASITENIAYGRPGAPIEEIRSAAHAAGADGFIRALPDGYDTVIGERGATLSGGERQRLSLARALLKDAPVLILDEPTSSLDVLTESALLERLRELRRGRTTILIAHRLWTVRHADRIAVLDRGQLVELGSHDELLRLPGLYATMWRSATVDRPYSVLHGSLA
jgi:ATP-binding cassette subfamily B protein/subfamily B ATP-binding cassette protein MsbA